MTIRSITIRERGPTPRKLRKAMTAAKRVAWMDAAAYFHTRLREARFTHSHARGAGYRRRTLKYEQRKRKLFGHTRPLEFTGETRRLTRMARLTATTKSGRAAYPGARKFNLRNPKSQVRMAEEFRRITEREAKLLGEVFDEGIDRELGRFSETSTKTVT